MKFLQYFLLHLSCTHSQNLVYQVGEPEYNLESSNWNYTNQELWPGYCNSGTKQSPIKINTNAATIPPFIDEALIPEFIDKSVRGDYLDIDIDDPSQGHSLKFNLIREIDNSKALNQQISLQKLKNRKVKKEKLTSISCSQFHFHFNQAEHQISNSEFSNFDNEKYFGEMHLVCYDNIKYKNMDEAIQKGDLFEDPNAVYVIAFFIDVCDDPQKVEEFEFSKLHQWQIQKMREDRSYFEEMMKEISKTFKGFSKDDCFNEDFQNILEIKKNYPNSTPQYKNTYLPLPKLLNNYYRYEGSFTTPDCNEIVSWSIFEDAIFISKNQMEEVLSWADFSSSNSNDSISYSHLINNNRDIQENPKPVYLYNYNSGRKLTNNLLGLVSTFVFLQSFLSY